MRTGRCGHPVRADRSASGSVVTGASAITGATGASAVACARAATLGARNLAAAATTPVDCLGNCGLVHRSSPRGTPIILVTACPGLI